MDLFSSSNGETASFSSSKFENFLLNKRSTSSLLIFFQLKTSSAVKAWFLSKSVWQLGHNRTKFSNALFALSQYGSI